MSMTKQAGEKMLIVKGELTDEEMRARVIIGVASGALGALAGALGSFLFRKFKVNEKFGGKKSSTTTPTTKL